MTEPATLDPRKVPPARDLVAVIMAVGLATAVNVITVAALWAALNPKAPNIAGGLSENATQVLTTAFGGMIGVLGSYVGYRTAQRQAQIVSDATEYAATNGGARP